MTTSSVPASESTPAVDHDMDLGIFCLNVSGGLPITRAADHSLTWDRNLAVGQAADAAGWDFLLPLGRWRGAGGATNAHGKQFESFTWAAGMAAATKQIRVFSTCHVPLVHPLMAAKQGATIDHIGGGRFGMNIVSGWNEAEFGMFGVAQIAHDDRYAAADEWLTIVERLWTDTDPVDFEGKHFTIRDGYLEPKPLHKPRPPIVSAGTSDAGLDFAMRRADYLFQCAPDMESLRDVMAKAKEKGAEVGSTTKMLTHGTVVVRDTEAEAKRYFQWWVDEMGDFEAAANTRDQMIGGGSSSLPPHVQQALTRGLVIGWGAKPLIGTPEQVVDQLLDLHKLGMSGIALGWVDYVDGFAEFNERVIPLMIEAGLRQDVQSS
jgi:dimethylsulfone monooxygenase